MYVTPQTNKKEHNLSLRYNGSYSLTSFLYVLYIFGSYIFFFLSVFMHFFFFFFFRNQPKNIYVFVGSRVRTRGLWAQRSQKKEKKKGKQQIQPKEVMEGTSRTPWEKKANESY